jgi:hypothetical protein
MYRVVGVLGRVVQPLLALVALVVSPFAQGFPKHKNFPDFRNYFLCFMHEKDKMEAKNNISSHSFLSKCWFDSGENNEHSGRKSECILDAS